MMPTRRAASRPSRNVIRADAAMHPPKRSEWETSLRLPYFLIVVNLAENCNTGRGLYARELADSLLHLLPWIREVFQPAGQEVFVGLQVEVPMAAQVKEDHPWTAVALGLKRFVGGFADRMRRLRRRDNPLCPCKLQGGFKHRPLLIRYGLDVLVVIEQTHQGRVPVVAQPSGVNGRRDKTVPQRVHFQQRRGGRRVAEVIQIHAAGQRRACFGLDGDDANLLALELVRQEGERQPGHVAPPPRSTRSPRPDTHRPAPSAGRPPDR